MRKRGKARREDTIKNIAWLLMHGRKQEPGLGVYPRGWGWCLPLLPRGDSDDKHSQETSWSLHGHG